MSDFSKAEIEAAATAMIVEMFAPHELPVNQDIWERYCTVAREALKAADRVRADENGAP